MNHLQWVSCPTSKFPEKKKNPDYLDTHAKCLDSFKWSCDLSEENVLEMSYMFHLYL